MGGGAGTVTVEGGDSDITGGEGANLSYGDWKTIVIKGTGTLVTTGWCDTISGDERGDSIFGDFETIDGTVNTSGRGLADVIDGAVGSDTADGGPGDKPAPTSRTNPAATRRHGVMRSSGTKSMTPNGVRSGSSSWA